MRNTSRCWKYEKKKKTRGWRQHDWYNPKTRKKGPERRNVIDMA